jgi:hypothetical protein
MEKQMTDSETATHINQDWAIFPPDRTSDSQRWIRLIEEMDEVFIKTESAEKGLAPMLMDQPLREPKGNIEPRLFDEPSSKTP